MFLTCISLHVVTHGVVDAHISFEHHTQIQIMQIIHLVPGFFFSGARGR